MSVKQCPLASIASQRSKSTAVLFSGPPIPNFLLKILSTLLKVKNKNHFLPIYLVELSTVSFSL